MYGLIGKMLAAPGKRDELIAILLEGTAEMPGCLSYLIARDAENEDALWVTEVWESRDATRPRLPCPRFSRRSPAGGR